MNNHSLRNLPQTIQTIAELVGMPATARLVEAFGGTTFPVPVGGNRKKGLMRRAALGQVVGDEAAEKIVRHFGGSELYIPRCAYQLRASRDQALIKDFDELCAAGLSANEATNELALKYRLSNRRVYDILNQPLPQAPDRQISLF